MMLFCYTPLHPRRCNKDSPLLDFFISIFLVFLICFLIWIEACEAGIRSKLREGWGWSLFPLCLHGEWVESKWWEEPVRLHQSIQKISTEQLGEKTSPALNAEIRGNCDAAPWNFAQYSGFLPTSPTFGRWSMSTAWLKRDNRGLCWCWVKPLPTGLLGLLQNQIKMPLIYNLTQNWFLSLKKVLGPSKP